MVNPIRLQPDQNDDFEVIRDLGPAKLRTVDARLRQIEPLLMPLERLSSTVAECLGGNAVAADSIVREALWCFGWIQQGGLDVAEVQAVIRTALKDDFHWNDRDVEKWRGVEPVFSEILGSPILRSVADTIDLTRIQRLDRMGRTDAALDLLYDAADQMMRQEQFIQLDATLATIQPADFSADILLSILTATLPARNRLASRAHFIQDVEKVLRERGEYEEGLLTGLV